MNEDQAIAAIRAYFAGLWGVTTQVHYDDEIKDTPNGATWVRLSIKHLEGDQTTAGDPGNNRHRQIGLIFVQVFQPQGNASKDARTKASLAASHFRGKTTQGIHFYQTSTREIGNDGKGFYQINVVVRFRYDIFA